MSHPATKRRKLGPEQEFEEITVTEYEEDIDEIIARINEQEESEKLAHQLQAEWDTNTDAVTKTKTKTVINVDQDFIVIDDDEDDEAMAHRLAREEEYQDVEYIPPPTSAASSSRLVPAKQRTVISSKTQKAATPPDTNLLDHRSLFTLQRNCTKCNKAVDSPRGFVVFSASVPPPTLLSLLHAPCHSCKTNHCRGCFTFLQCPITCNGKDLSCSVGSCCAEGRAIAIFEALGGLDRKYIEERNSTVSRITLAAERTKAKRPASGSVGPGGTGYGNGAYKPGSTPTTNKKRKDPGGVDLLASHWDKNLVAGLNTLTALLPEPYAENPQVFDLLPHSSIGHLISLSYLPEILSGLLRNDSVSDWVERSEAYYAMIALLRRMVDCELTVECLIRPRWEKHKSCGIEDWMWGDGCITWQIEKNCGKDNSDIARDPPLYENFKRLHKQCEAFLAGASQMMASADDGDLEELVQATSICGDIIAARDDLDRTIVALGGSPVCEGHPRFLYETGKKISKGKDRDPAIDMEKTYSTECERLAFKHVDTLSGDGRQGFGDNYSHYNYASMLHQTASATRNPKDRLHLIKELAAMATCLPPGVWVRVDEVRHDAIKIMIAGPEDTPYAGGLFEFDCFMPLEYPRDPPLIHLRTTGGGSVRFNPNLYNNGKVCLSLLGTWPGSPEEQWSTKSTLLQVIVSIQSMIFVEAPYFNEPGHGKADLRKPASIQYNRNIVLQTARWGIVEWLKDEYCHSLWEEVIVSHFLIRHDKMRSCLQIWAINDSQMTNYKSDVASAQWGGAPLSPLGVSHLQMTSNTGRLNLLEEYDTGLARIKTW